jgi:hypothetical protein
MLNLAGIVNELKQQRGRLDSAIQALEGHGSVDHVRSFRKPKRKGKKGVRKLSAAARRRISAGMKARWKKAKKAGKNSL